MHIIDVQYTCQACRTNQTEHHAEEEDSHIHYLYK